MNEVELIQALRGAAVATVRALTDMMLLGKMIQGRPDISDAIKLAAQDIVDSYTFDQQQVRRANNELAALMGEEDEDD